MAETFSSRDHSPSGEGYPVRVQILFSAQLMTSFLRTIPSNDDWTSLHFEPGALQFEKGDLLAVIPFAIFIKAVNMSVAANCQI